MRIAISYDEHDSLIEELKIELQIRGHEVLCFGPQVGSPSQDWPDVTLQAARAVLEKKADEAIVLCWTGTGSSIVANKLKGIRAALCHDAATAKGARTWNWANVLALSLRTTSKAILKEILDAWFSTPYGQDKWNRKQIEKLERLES